MLGLDFFFFLLNNVNKKKEKEHLDKEVVFAI